MTVGDIANRAACWEISWISGERTGQSFREEAGDDRVWWESASGEEGGET